MAKALYRKYRPRKLAEVVGQEQVTDVLQNSLKRGRASHAYLFVGPRGTGKTSVARIFAHEINGFDYELEDDYVDIVEIDGASNRGIDDIRELREKAAIAPSQGKFKVYIIDEVHMLTKEAFNALLKTLEEPPAHVVFIMATTDVQKVPNTIISRAQSYTFRLADAETMQKFLREVADKEGIKISDEALAVVMERGGGSFRDSLSLLDQIAALSEGEISRELVVAALGLPEKERVERILAAYEGGDLQQITAALREMMASGIKAEVLAEELVARIVAEPTAVRLPLLTRLTEVAAPFVEAKLLVALCSSDSGTRQTFFAGHAQGRSAEPTVPQKSLSSSASDKRTSQPSKQADQAQMIKEECPQFLEEHLPAEPGREHGPERSEGIRSREAHRFREKSEGVPHQEPEATTDFDYAQFVTKVRDASEAIFSQLKNTVYEVRGGTLQIYPQKKIAERILKSARNLAVLQNLAAPVQVRIHELGDQPVGKAKSGAGIPANPAQNSAAAAKISAIMGGEVIQDGGDNPF